MVNVEEPSKSSGEPGLRRTDFSWLDVWILAGSAVVTVGLVALAAYDLRPFGGESAVYVLGFVLVSLLHAGVAAAILGSIIEWRQPGWTFFGEGHHVVLAVCLVALTGAMVFVDWWVMNQSIGTRPAIGYWVAVVLGVLIGATLEFLIVSPKHLRNGGEKGAIYLGSAALGMIAGAAMTVALVVGVAFVRNHSQGGTVAQVPTVHQVVGEYVALGDSYSAGEGLRPFSPHTGSAKSNDGNGCHRSDLAYSQWLVFDPPQPAVRFVACSGAVTADVTKGYDVVQGDGSSFTVDPQVEGVHPEVGLVTITMGGNDVLFSKIVIHCLTHDDCMNADFAPPDTDHRTIDYPDTQPLGQWAVEAADRLSGYIGSLYANLRQSYPNARIVVIGYPYLFPGGGGGFKLNDCDSVLRRFSEGERGLLRSLQDQFNDLLYEQAVNAGVEFVSPAAIWDGHEPCGSKGQYTNAIKPIFSKDVVDGGTFHPNAAGQQALGRLVACYLAANESAPNPFVDGQRHPLDITGLVPPSELGLVEASGVLGSPIENC